MGLDPWRAKGHPGRFICVPGRNPCPRAGLKSTAWPGLPLTNDFGGSSTSILGRSSNGGEGDPESGGGGGEPLAGVVPEDSRGLRRRLHPHRPIRSRLHLRDRAVPAPPPCTGPILSFFYYSPDPLLWFRFLLSCSCGLRLSLVAASVADIPGTGAQVEDFEKPAASELGCV